MPYTRCSLSHLSQRHLQAAGTPHILFLFTSRECLLALLFCIICKCSQSFNNRQPHQIPVSTKHQICPLQVNGQNSFKLNHNLGGESQWSKSRDVNAQVIQRIKREQLLKWNFYALWSKQMLLATMHNIVVPFWHNQSHTTSAMLDLHIKQVHACFAWWGKCILSLHKFSCCCCWIYQQNFVQFISSQVMWSPESSLTLNM